MEQVEKIMTRAVLENIFPGGVLLVSVKGSVIFDNAFGFANIISGKRMTKDTIFDLASLTKPLATSLAVVKLVQEGKLAIDNNLGSILPQFENTEKEPIEIRNLLCHNSGFPDYRPYYLTMQDIPQKNRQGALRDMLVKEPLLSIPGEKALYSDLGFMILRWVVETVSGRRLDRFVTEEIYEPLGLRNLFFVDLYPKDKSREPGNRMFAATEIYPWRNMLIEGVVHDDNAYAAGGIEGHAGLFGTARDVNFLLTKLLFTFHGISDDCLIARELIKIFFDRQEETDWALGFDTPSLTGSSCGRYFSRKSVGHLGFTGTSFWMDLDRFVSVILLTNRVHPSRDNVKIKEFRPVLPDAVMRDLLSKGIL
ncbi:MAG: serine hydrolase domain-containing protein [Pseudomonadota bacterium]